MSYHSVLFFQPLTLQAMLPTKSIFLPPLPLVVSFPHSLRLSVISDLPSFPFLSRLVHVIPFLSESELRIPYLFVSGDQPKRGPRLCFYTFRGGAVRVILLTFDLRVTSKFEDNAAFYTVLRCKGLQG